MSTLPKTKVCRKCNQSKPLDKFYRKKSAKDGRLSRCDECERSRINAWIAANRERRREQSRAWEKRNPEKVKASRKRIAANPTPSRLSWLERYWADPVNAEKKREYDRRWAAENKPKRAAKEARRRARKRESEGNYTAEEFLAKVAAYKGRCHWCGKRIEGTPQADHVIALARGGANDIGNIVPSCKSCNFRKHTKLPWEFNGRLL
jgi:hypothetical protein